MRERIEHTEHRRPSFTRGAVAPLADATPTDRPVAERPAESPGFAGTSRS
jgi:hypothetical protein